MPLRRFTTSEEIISWLADAGVVADARTVARVVIDLKRGSVPVVHVEHHADAQLLSVVQALGGIEITGVPAGTAGLPGIETKDAGSGGQ